MWSKFISSTKIQNSSLRVVLSNQLNYITSVCIRQIYNFIFNYFDYHLYLLIVPKVIIIIFKYA